METGNMDMELFEALLANMQQNLPQGAYDDLDDDDDDDDYDEDDDDEDDDYDYAGNEHSIHTMANPYGAGDGGVGGGDLGGGDLGGVSLPTMQTMSMSILQGLLNMNPGAVPDMGGGMGGAVSPGIPGMGGAVEGGAGNFLSNMPAFLPSMNPDMAGALAGAFAGGMNALMEGYGGAGNGATLHDYDDDDDDDEVLSDEEEEDDDDDELEDRRGINPVAAAAGGVALGAVGGMVASGLLSSGHPSSSHLVPGSHSGHPALAGHMQRPPSHGPIPSHGPPIGFVSPYNPADMMGPPSSHGPRPHVLAPSSSSIHHTSMAPSMSGGSVQSVDPLAGVTMAAAGVVAGAGILAPVVGSLLASSDNKPLSKLDTSDASSVTLVDEDSINSPSKSLSNQDRPAESVTAVATALEKTHITQSEKDPSKTDIPKANGNPAENKKSNEVEGKDKNIVEVTPQCRVTPSDELEDDKSSVGSDSVPSSEAGDGKSDTESVRKKTPSPVPEGKLGRLSPTGSDSAPVLESASCASITDLASATESMRDSDTDNHSDAHNVTANLSDLDNDIHENQPKVPLQTQYAVGALPIVIEKPTFGWQSMVGLDTAKDALKELFMGDAFPEVFEGTQGICKGVLLFGPSGSGKTCLARALAKESNDAILIGISTAYLASQVPLEAPKIVRYLFDHARMHSPAVILFDEIDALCYDRSSETVLRAKSELLAQIRGRTTLNPPYPPFDPLAINDGLMVLGTTNQPWLLDDELRRIFTYNIHVKLPGEKAREELLRMFLQNLTHNINDDQFKCLVAKSEGYSAADINTVIRQVAHMPPVDPSKYIGNMARVITYDDLATVMTDYRCRFTSEVSTKYQSYIKAATHRSEDRQEESKKEKERPKGVKRIGQRIAKSIAAALVAVID
ncbi:uncharacterized protein [Palaemon carinicauda]|uniref:uncharacterized protein n=1 Tax=Palaemon carinicauda TaxID=392227 RepID=UPI0035B68628